MRVPSLTAAARGASLPASRRTTRAFTLMEMMVVVILIGILTAMAVPTMAEARYNARTLDDATKIAELYREARTRAMGRGSAMLVQAVSSNVVGGTESGAFSLFEGQVVGSGPANGGSRPLPGGSPVSSCGFPAPNANASFWQNIIANPSNTLIDYVTMDTAYEKAANMWSQVSDSTGLQPVTSLCYTPLGRAYYLPNANPVFTAGANVFHGQLQIVVQRTDNPTGTPVQNVGPQRTVIIPDSGSTRIVSK